MIATMNLLEKKTELLSKGIYIEEKWIKHYEKQGILFDYGRKGGAGPIGGRYFQFDDDDNTLVNVALWNDRKKSNLILKDRINGFFNVYDDEKKELFCRLKLIEYPSFYNLKTSDGILMKKIALMHGIDCLGTTIYQKCKHWACGEACKFCSIELSLDNEATILEKNHKQISEVITAAKKEGKCSHVTLTSGTTEDDKEGIKRYVRVLVNIKRAHPDVSLHVQIEPVRNLDYLHVLKEAGADTIGIHIEILDEALRKKFTPGKSKIPYQLYVDNWKKALEVFGRNQVESYVLLGFDESIEIFLENLEHLISIGVIPYITPVRSAPNIESTVQNLKPGVILQIYMEAAKMMKKYNVNPLENVAGCVRCGGCSAIIEAYKCIDN